MGTNAFARLLWRTLAVAALLLLGCPAVRADIADAGTPPSEYAVKAAFLFNFAKFVTWPPAAFPAPDAPVLIGILGEDPFDGEILRLAADVRVQGRPIVIKHGANVAELADCQVIFFSRSEDDRLAQWFRALREQHIPALTVGETDAFLAAGGMIRFVMAQRKVRFEIEPDRATAAQLTISSKLLRLAVNQRVRPS